MSLGTQSARIKEACSMLTIAWERAGEQWSDEQHQRIGERFILPLRTSMRAADSAIDAMNEVLLRARRDCS